MDLQIEKGYVAMDSKRQEKREEEVCDLRSPKPEESKQLRAIDVDWTSVTR
jgi:hypothetical protein